MKISHRNIPKFQNGTTNEGIGTVSWTDPNSTWFTRSGNSILEETYNYLKSLSDKWNTTKSYSDYRAFKDAVDQLNNHLRTGYAPNHLRYLLGNNLLFTDSKVGDWQNTIKNNYSFVNDAIGNHFSEYKIHSSNPLSGDNPTTSYKVDNHLAGITQDRTPWGYYGNENDPDYLKWKEKFSELGIEYKTRPDWNTGNVLYGFLKDDIVRPNKGKAISLPINTTISKEELDKLLLVVTNHAEGGYGFDWSKINQGLQNLLSNPNVYAFGRLAGNLINNERVYDEALKGIKPTLKLTYQTHRLVVGDEATKLAYYKRAAESVTKASRPITSDLDKQMAYQMEAQRQANELRAQGDLADNQEIRRTSDESNLHLWANTQRATEVANANLAELNLANALKHNLLALKHSALWSSIDNYLQGIEYRKRQQLAELLLLEDQIWSLKHTGFLYSPEYLQAYAEYLKVREQHKDENGIYHDTDPDVTAARIKFENFIKLAKIRELRDLQDYKRSRYTINFGKSGTKLTYKKKDDLLYKSARDKVEHFRKISKIASDTHNRKQNKLEKLTSHPKNVKKYAQGGVGPFTVYTPIALGGETSKTVESNSTTSKSLDKGKDTLDLIKSLFLEIAGKGLKVDVETIYTSISNLLQLAQFFGEDLSTSDIQAMYLQAMYLLNSVQRSKDIFDKAKAYATLNDALNEFAVTSDGRYIIQDKETGKISVTTNDWEEAKKLGNPITNAQLLNLREYSPQLLLYNGDLIIDNVVNSGMGLNKIAAQIKAMAGNIGSSTEKIEGLTEVLSLKVKAGVLLLEKTDGTPDGIYQVTTKNLNSLAQINAALEYIRSMLSPSQLAILKTHGDPKKLITNFLSSQTSSTLELTLTPVTGKASKSTNGSSSGDNDMIPAVAFFLGLGDNLTFIILDKTLDGIKIDTVSLPITSGNKNTGSITFDKLESSDYGGLLRIDLATMGDALIAPNGRNNIIIGGKIYQTELPIDQQAATHGIIKPDFSFLKNIEKANLLLRNIGIDKNNPDDVAKNIDKINQVYRDNQLPILYTTDGNKPVITSSYARFAMVNATATKDAFEEDPNFNDGVREATDLERKLFESSMKLLSGDSKYTLNNGYFGGRIGGDDLYIGIIYIPMGTSTISALSGTGYKAKGEEYNLMEVAQQAANAAMLLGFKSAGNFSSHN